VKISLLCFICAQPDVIRQAVFEENMYS